MRTVTRLLLPLAIVFTSAVSFAAVSVHQAAAVIKKQLPASADGPYRVTLVGKSGPNVRAFKASNVHTVTDVNQPHIKVGSVVFGSIDLISGVVTIESQAVPAMGPASAPPAH